MDVLTADETMTMAMKIAASIVATVASVALAEFNRFIKDKSAREKAAAFMKWAAPLALNSIDGLIKDHPLPAIQVPGAVGLMLSLAKPAEIAAFKRIGLEGDGLTKFAIAHLPGVQGEISDSDISAITAAVNAPPSNAPAGQPAPKTSPEDIAKALGPLVGRLIDIKLAELRDGAAARG